MKISQNSRVGLPSVLKEMNSAFLRARVHGRQVFTKPQLAKEMGLSLVTVNKIIDEKIISGEILCTGVQSSSGGRKAKSYCFNEDHQVILVLFIQENIYYTTLMNLSGKVLYESTYPHEAQDWTKELLERIDALLEFHSDKNISAIGIAVPGSVDAGVIDNIPSIPQWEGLSLQNILEARYPHHIIIENDINLTAMGVWSKKKLDTSNMVLLHIQKGLRASIIIDGKLHKGRHNFAGEISFLKIQGISPNEHIENIIASLIQKNRREELIDIIIPILINIICIIEPDYIAMGSYQIDEDLCSLIQKKLEQYIELKYIPTIKSVNYEERFYFHGAYYLWLEKSYQMAGFFHSEQGMKYD